MKFLRAASQCLRVCVYARVCVCVRVCVWTCQFRVELLSKTHTSNKSNVTTGRNGTATHLLLPPPCCRCWWWRTLACSICSLCVRLCVCLYSASGVAAAVNCRQFPRQSSAGPSPSLCHCLHLLLLAHTHYTHTTTTAVYVPMCELTVWVCVRLLI